MNFESGISVLTATFNRRRLLEELFRSLQAQTNQSFEWVIVDDGSTDGTRDAVAAWQKNTTFPIIISHQANSGKQAAINRGIDFASHGLVAIVDSDDFLLPDAVERILATWRAHSARQEELSGLFCAMQHEASLRIADGRHVEVVTSAREQFDRRKVADFVPVIRRDLLETNRFPLVAGERFIAEGSLWNRLSFDRGCLFLNRPVAVCRYQADGATAHSVELRRKNVQGTLRYYAEADDHRLGRINRFKARCNYQRFALHARDDDQRANSRAGVIERVIGWLLYLRDRRRGTPRK